MEDDFEQPHPHNEQFPEEDGLLMLIYIYIYIYMQDGWRWKMRLTINVYHMINLYCRESIIPEIKKTLKRFGDDRWNEFMSSCFGHLTSLPENTVRCNQSIHHVVSRQIVFDDGDMTELWFRVNNKNLRFSREDHALVTGLRFGGSNFNPNENHRILDNYFYSRFLRKKKITVSNLWSQFIQRTLGRNASDYVKVVKILFVYYILFGFDIMHYINRIRTDVSLSQRKTYHLYGFITAFQAWIYCVIPKLGITSGGIISMTSIPRILRYAFNRTNLNPNDISGEEARNVRVCPPARGLLNGDHAPTRPPHLLDGDENEYVVNIAEDHIDHGPSTLSGPTNKQGDGLPKGPTFGPDDPIYGFTSSQRQALVHEVGEYTFGRVIGWMDTVIPQHIETVLRRVLPEYMTQNKNLYEREKGDKTTKENSHETTTKPTTPTVLHNECNDDQHNMSVDEREVRETYEPTIVRQIWLKHHKEGMEENIPVNIEEQLSEEDLQGLSKYVTGDLPSWGLPKPWDDYTQLVMPCHLPGHWVAVVVYLNEHTISIFDSTRHNWTHADADARIEFMKPLTRILPQMLKYCGYWEARSELVPKYTQWAVKFSRAEDTLIQQDSTSCGIFALLHIE
ncbi:hypothetical protein C2S52_003415 [Perilla frutescens var. hirtella]|nr:hypothetical protein C2S52_003415 [Perilla frutescens var. hirtella]